jgi:DNA-binding CsgD family transcriptional regulator
VRLKNENILVIAIVLIANSYLFVVIVSMGIIVPLMLLVSFAFLTRRQEKKENILVSYRIKLELESAKKSLENHRLREDNLFRDQQMSMFKKTMEKRHQLQEFVRNQLERSKKESIRNVRPKLIELTDAIKESADERSEDWKSFEQMFDLVHPQYLQNFATVFPELSIGEIRLCALLKLNLESKQIANILNLTNEGAKVAKYRLRKKLKLTGDESLIVFFNSI